MIFWMFYAKRETPKLKREGFHSGVSTQLARAAALQAVSLGFESPFLETSFFSIFLSNCSIK